MRVQGAEGEAEPHVLQAPVGSRCQPPAALFPPSTCRVVPVTNLLTIAAEVDRGRRDVVDVAPARQRRLHLEGRSAPMPGVGMTSGAMQFTRISRDPSSSASDSVRLATAAFIDE